MKTAFRSSAILVVLTLLGCSQDTPSAPACRTTDEKTHTEQQAACVIKTEYSVLMIRHRLSGRLDFPGGGTLEGESLACTAHRETWEETGLNVLVRDKVAVTKNGLALFACDENADLDQLPTEFSAPHWSAIEVIQLEKVKPFELDHDHLRYPDDLIPLRDAYVAHGAKTQ